MSKVILLKELKAFTLDVTRDLIFPVAQQKEDKEPPKPRAAEVFCTRLPDSKSAKKKAPYILHQFINDKTIQPKDQRLNSTAVVRSIFCVYNPDEQEGGLALLTLMDQLYLSLLERPIVGAQFTLDLEAGMESMAYPEDSAPYFAGEMVTVWRMPPVIYIGPNIKGLIQTGSIYRGDREHAHQMAAAAIEKHPKVKTLIVAGDALPEARLRVKTPGNVLYANYNELKKPEGK